MHELAAGQDTQKSWPVGITGFGLGVTDQPRAEALAGTEALAGIPATPARMTAASRTDILAAIPLTLPSRERRRPAVGQPDDTVPPRPAASSAAAADAVTARIARSTPARRTAQRFRPPAGISNAPAAAATTAARLIRLAIATPHLLPDNAASRCG